MKKLIPLLVSSNFFAPGRSHDGWYPFNPLLGQKMQTGVEGLEIDAGYIAHYQVSAANAIAASDHGCHVAFALAALAQAGIVADITNPKTPRNVTVKGNAAGCAGDVKIYGTDIADNVIDETIALADATVVQGTKAFKTVTKIDFPVEVHAGTDTVEVGYGDLLGIPFKLSHNTVVAAAINNVREATAPTVTVDAADISKNTVDLNSALAGTVVDIYLIV